MWLVFPSVSLLWRLMGNAIVKHRSFAIPSCWHRHASDCGSCFVNGDWSNTCDDSKHYVLLEYAYRFHLLRRRRLVLNASLRHSEASVRRLYHYSRYIHQKRIYRWIQAISYFKTSNYTNHCFTIRIHSMDGSGDDHPLAKGNPTFLRLVVLLSPYW